MAARGRTLHAREAGGVRGWHPARAGTSRASTAPRGASSDVQVRSQLFLHAPGARFIPEQRLTTTDDRLRTDTMRLIPHHQDDSHGHREYRSPDGTWRVVRTRQPGGNRNERPCWEVHERPEAHAPWHCHAAFERRRDALVFLDTTAVTPVGAATISTAAPPKQRETLERQDEPTGASPPRKPRRRITHDIDETRSEGRIRWSLCGVLLYDERQIAKGGDPSTCGKCQRFTTAASYRKRQEAMKAAKRKP